MDYSQPRVSSANLSRAYATLRRLDVLRAQDIIQPIAVHTPAPANPNLASVSDPAPLPMVAAPRARPSDATHVFSDAPVVSHREPKAAPLASARPLATVAPAAAPPRFQPMSPTANTSLLEETSRLTHPTTLASSSFFSRLSTPITGPMETPRAPSDSPSIRLAQREPPMHGESREVGVWPTPVSVHAPLPSEASLARHPAYASARAVLSPALHVDVEHRYRPRRGLHSTAHAASGAISAPHASGAATATTPTPRDRVGDYRGHDWDNAPAEPSARASARRPPTSSSAASAPPLGGSEHRYHAPAASKTPAPTPETATVAMNECFFDLDPVRQVAVAVTRGGFQPLSIARDSADRAAAAAEAEMSDTAADVRVHVDRPRSPLVSTQDHSRRPLRRPLESPARDDDSDNKYAALNGDDEDDEDVVSAVESVRGADASSFSTEASHASSSGSSASHDEDEEAAALVRPHPSEPPFARLGGRAPWARQPPLPPSALDSSSIEPPVPPPTREKETRPLPQTTPETSKTAGPTAQQLVETYQLRQAQLRARLEPVLPSVDAADGAAQATSLPSRTSGEASPSVVSALEASVEVGEVTRVGGGGESALVVPPAQDAAPTQPAATAGAATTDTTSAVAKSSSTSTVRTTRRSSPLRPASVVSYKDYLVQSPRPRSTTASRDHVDQDGDEEDEEGASYDDAQCARGSERSRRARSSRASASSRSEDSPPRLTAASSSVALTCASDEVSVVPHPRRRGQDRPSAPDAPDEDSEDLVAFVEAIHMADAETLAEVLASMEVRDHYDGDTESNDNPVRFTEDCLVLTVVMNRHAVIEAVVLPWLVQELETVHARLLTVGPLSTASSSSSPQQWRRRRAALLCALTGFGPRARAAGPTLQTLLLDLTSEGHAGAHDEDALALVLLAMRASGGTEAVHYLRTLLRAPSQTTSDLLTWHRRRAAAAFGLGLMSLDVVGHTTVLCVPSSSTASTASPSLLLYAPDELPKPSDSATGGESRAGEIGATDDDEDGAGGASTASYREVLPASLTKPSQTTRVLAPPSLQRPPPYTPTHVLVDVRCARAALQTFVSAHSEALARPDQTLNLGVVLHDLLQPWLAQAVSGASGANAVSSTEPPSAATLTTDATSTSLVVRGQALVRAGLSDVMETIEATWRAPVLPYSHTTYFADKPAIAFEVERSLLSAAISPMPSSSSSSSSSTSSSVARAASTVQEVAVLALASLPSQARPHSAVPLLEYVELCAARTPSLAGAALPARYGTPFTHADGETSSSPIPASSAAAVSGAESALSAAVLALGSVATPEAVTPAQLRRTASLLAALVRHAPSARVRHGAMAGLGFLALAWSAASDAATAEDRKMDDEDEARPFRRVLPVVLRLSTVCLLDCSVSPETVAWTCVCGGAAGARHLLHLLRTDSTTTAEAPRMTTAEAPLKVIAKDGERATPRLTTRAQLACVQALLSAPLSCPSSLLDELIDTLGTLAISQGLVEESLQRACVRVLARTVYTASIAAAPPPPRTTTSTALSVRPAHGASRASEEDTEVFDCDMQTAPNETFKVLRSILESSTVPYSVLCELFRCLCAYGGTHGELYACQTCLESRITAARGAAAYGLRGAGARTIRILALALTDTCEEVREEAEATVALIGVPSIVAVLARRPAEHVAQVTAALRDCLLLDLGRGQTHAVLEALYEVLNEGGDTARLTG